MKSETSNAIDRISSSQFLRMALVVALTPIVLAVRHPREAGPRNGVPQTVVAVALP